MAEILEISYRCFKCGVSKPISEFRKNPSDRRGHHATCKLCDKSFRAERLLAADKLRSAAVASGHLKACRICEVSKPIFQFSRCATSPDGSRHECQKCSIKRSRDWEKKISREDRLAVYRRHRLKKKYGLTDTAFQAMKAAQNNRCAICSVEFVEKKGARSAAVDHDHKTGAVRAILCSTCNIGIGHFDDQPETLLAAAAYLDRHKRQD